MRQVALLFGLAASIALGGSLVRWAMTPEYVPLLGDMTQASTSDVLKSLEASGIDYRFNSGSGVVSVQGDKVHQARLQLASEGLPGQDPTGFGTLYQEQQMGTSSFMERARYDRALEQELAQSIASLDSVKAARVHLALPPQSAFVRKTSKPAASVLLSLYAGRALTDRQLAGVVFLVASSVPGLSAENVSVVDNQGKLLSSQNNDDGFAQSKEQLRFTQELEQGYAQRINEILTPILGVGAFRAQVTADVDYTIVERTSESFAPEKNIRSEQLTEELTQSGLAEGIPGTLSNNPPRETVGSGEAPEDVAVESEAQPLRSSKSEVRNYELGKTISHVREVPGGLKKLSVAVVVDYRTAGGESGEPEQVPLSEQQLAEVNSLVREAVGFNEARGDSVNVVSASFVAIPELEPMPEPSLLEQDWVWKIAKISLAGLGFVLLIFSVLRPLMQASVGSSGKQLAGPQGGDPRILANADGDDAMQMREDQVTLGQQQLGLPAGAPVYEQQLSMARSMVQKEPERVAHVVKNWVASDG